MVARNRRYTSLVVAKAGKGRGESGCKRIRGFVSSAPSNPSEEHREEIGTYETRSK